MDHGAWLWKKKNPNDKTWTSVKRNQQEKTLQDKLACLLSECNAKDELVSSHSKAAQEAMAGWEKAEADARLRKQKLDEALQKKIAERERFYAELKDCVQKFLSSAREEQDKMIDEAVMKATQELENKHKKLEEKYGETIRMVAALTFENSQLTTALQVKEKLIEDTKEKMSKVMGEYSVLMSRVDSTEKEYASLKSEYQTLEKELELRNEEMEFNREYAEATGKKHLEDVKKIKKLEAECRRLRLLVRKRLLGPAGLAKMKSEVEMEGTDVRDRRISYMIERVCDVEEENKILKEIACSKDEEVRSLRNAFALLVSKLSQVEDQLGDNSKTQKSMELINGFGSWASGLLSQLENFERGEGENKYEGRMTKVSDISQTDDFVELEEKLAMVSVNPPSGNSYDSIGKELVPFDMDSTEKPRGWLKNVLEVILEQSRVSQRSINEILEDITVALKYADTTDFETSKQLAVSYISWNSSNTVGMENKSEQSFERLQLELESLQESKRLLEEQIENLKLINEDLDKQLNVSRDQSNELLQKITSLETELEDKSHSYEQLEATCLKLQSQLDQSVSSKELREDEEERDENLFHAAWESTEVADREETIMNNGTQLEAATPPKNPAVLDKVLSGISDTTLSQRSSLRDYLAEDGFEAAGAGDSNSPKTKEIISTSEMKISPIVESSFNDVKTTSVPAATLAIVPTKKRGGGFNLLRKIFFRRKKGGSKKKSRFRSAWKI